MHYFEPESLKIFWRGGTAISSGPTSIGEGDTPPQTTLIGECGASPHICQPPAVIFSQFSHCSRYMLSPVCLSVSL